MRYLSVIWYKPSVAIWLRTMRNTSPKQTTGSMENIDTRQCCKVIVLPFGLLMLLFLLLLLLSLLLFYTLVFIWTHLIIFLLYVHCLKHIFKLRICLPLSLGGYAAQQLYTHSHRHWHQHPLLWQWIFYCILDVWMYWRRRLCYNEFISRKKFQFLVAQQF